MSLIIQNFEELEGSVQKVFDNFVKSKVDLIPIFFNKESSDRNIETHLSLGAMGQMVEWDNSVNYDDISKGYENVYRHKKYSNGIKVEERLVRYKNFKEIKKRTNSLAYSVHKSLQSHAVTPFQNAFGTFLSPDSVALCSNSHHLVPGDDAQDNYDVLDLNNTNLDTVKTRMREFKDDRGDVMDVQGNLIICGEYWRKTAHQICSSTKEAYVADNQTNYFKDEGTKYFCTPRITGKKWFLVDEDLMKGGNGLNFYMPRDPRKVEYVQDFDTEEGKYKAVGEWSYGADTWYWVYGNNPT